MAQLHQTLVFIRTLKPLHHLNIIFKTQYCTSQTITQKYLKNLR